MYECIRSAHTPLILQAQTAGNGIASSICSAQHVTLTTALGRTCQRRYETIRKAEIVDARTAVANLECTIEGIFRCTPGSQHLRIKGVHERQRSRSAKFRREPHESKRVLLAARRGQNGCKISLGSPFFVMSCVL